MLSSEELPAQMNRRDSRERDILVVADFTGNLDKFDRHITPLAAVANPTVICINAIDHKDVTFKTTRSLGFRPFSLLLMFVHAFVEASRNDYDGIVSFSLLPHGIFALTIGRLHRTPVHLGIIGADIDVHANAFYRSLIVSLFHQFDAISVPGSSYEEELRRRGVSAEVIYTLTNTIPIDEYAPAIDSDRPTDYDYLWIGRFCDAKNPVTFVEILKELRRRGREFRAVMVGDGPLEDEVEAAIETYGLDDCIERPGWVDQPQEYYKSARIFFLTSKRDALPLTLLEAMATGTACVVPNVGNVSDIVSHERNGILVDNATVDDFLVGLRTLERDGTYETVVENAPEIRTQVSYQAAAEDWKAILDAMGIKIETRGGSHIIDAASSDTADSIPPRVAMAKQD